MFTAVCPSCERRQQVHDDYAGRKAVCPECRNVFQIPESNITAEAPPREKKEPRRESDQDDPQRPLALFLSFVFTSDMRRILTCFPSIAIGALFVQPWIDMHSGGRVVASRSGLDLCHHEASPAGPIPVAPLIIAVGVCVALGVVLAVLTMHFARAERPSSAAATLHFLCLTAGCVALACLGAQMAAGFPAGRLPGVTVTTTSWLGATLGVLSLFPPVLLLELGITAFLFWRRGEG